MPGSVVRKLSEHLLVHAGPINVGIIRDGARCLLIDCGDGEVAAGLPELGITTVDWLLFTHHHRDQACGAWRFMPGGAKVGVPATERGWFDNPSLYWNDPRQRWHLYCFHPHHLMLTEPLRVDATYADGHESTWGPARIRVLATPGHTDGSVSYLVEVDGIRVLFSGDAIHAPGQVWDFHSLQHSMGKWGDYHGFLGALPDLTASLRRLQGEQPTVLVPSHGLVMDRPAEAIEALIGRLGVLFGKYTAISALRHYDPEVFGPDQDQTRMPFCPPLPVPGCLRHFATTWVLIAADRSALVIDCGTPAVVERLRDMMASGEIRSVEGLWISHYHDDHVDGVPAFREAFDCPVIADRAVAEVITAPSAWRLACISPVNVRVDRVTTDAESWQWHEFRLTAYAFPGQTLYHGGLLAEADGRRLFFVGDSFAPSGIDDYCAQNRIAFGEGVGFDRCVALLEALQPTHLFNQHVASAFVFSAGQYATMRANLAEREGLMGRLLPWDHANQGLDDHWARCHPYEQQVQPGAEALLEVVVTNHSSGCQECSCRAVPSWDRAQPYGPGTTVAARSDGRISLRLPIPPGLAPGRHIIPIDLRFGSWSLPQFTEAVVDVCGAGP